MDRPSAKPPLSAASQAAARSQPCSWSAQAPQSDRSIRSTDTKTCRGSLGAHREPIPSAANMLCPCVRERSGRDPSPIDETLLPCCGQRLSDLSLVVPEQVGRRSTERAGPSRYGQVSARRPAHSDHRPQGGGCARHQSFRGPRECSPQCTAKIPKIGGGRAVAASAVEGVAPGRP